MQVEQHHLEYIRYTGKRILSVKYTDISHFKHYYSFDSTRYPAATSAGRSIPHTILQSQFDLSLPAGLVAFEFTWRIDGNANSPGTPSPSRTQRLDTSMATRSPSLCASRARRRPLTAQASVNIICRPSASTSTSPSLLAALLNLPHSSVHAETRARLVSASATFAAERANQWLNTSRLLLWAKCLTVSLARTLVVPSQTLLLAVSLHKRLMLNSGSSGSSGTD